MARGGGAVPIGEVEPDVPVQEGMRRIIPTARPSETGSAFGALAGEAIAAKDHIDRTDAASYVSQAAASLRVKAEQHLLDNQQKSPDDITKAGGLTPAVMTDFKASADGAIKDAPNSLAASLMRNSANSIGADLQIRTMKTDAANRIAQRSDAAQNAINMTASAVELNPDSWKDAGAEQLHAIQNMGLPDEEVTRLSRKADDDLSLAAGRGYAKQNPQAALARINDPKDPLFSGMSLQARAFVEAHAKDQLSNNQSDGIVAAYRNGGPAAGAKALTAIDTADLPDDVKDEVRQKAAAGVAQYHNEARQNNAQSIMGLEERLGTGKTQPNDAGLVLSLYNKGVYSPAEAGELRGRILKSQVKQVDDDSMFKYVKEAYQNGQALDPKDESIKKNIDAVFVDQTGGKVPAGSPEWINRGADIAAKTGVTPTSVINWARTNLVSGDVQSAANAAQAIQRQQDANPRGIGFALDDKTKAMARGINDAVTAGTPLAQAVENQRKISALPDADAKRLDEIYKKNQLAQKSEGDLKTQLKDTDNGFRAHFWNGIPDVPPQMTGQFEELRQNYFRLTNGNVDQSNKLATADLKNTWGITQVNGKKEFMQFAPEAMNPGLTTQAVRQDLEDTIKGETADPTKAQLISIPETFHSEGQKWGIGVPGKFGNYDVIRNPDGQPKQYQLPTATATVKAAHAKASADGLAQLHTKQQDMKDAENNAWVAIHEQERLGAF